MSNVTLSDPVSADFNKAETAGFRRFWLRVTACHVVTYTAAGLLAFTLLRYQSLLYGIARHYLDTEQDADIVQAVGNCREIDFIITKRLIC